MTKFWNRYVPEIDDYIHEHDNDCSGLVKDGCFCNWELSCKGDTE